ncbi:hypothetical protein D3C84_914620 [compost metagenome]
MIDRKYQCLVLNATKASCLINCLNTGQNTVGAVMATVFSGSLIHKNTRVWWHLGLKELVLKRLTHTI